MNAVQAVQAVQEEKKSHHLVEVSIDRKPHKSPDPTTGAALYVLGAVPPNYDLWREVCGKGDDELVPNDGSKIDLKEHEKFYSAQRTLNPGSGGEEQ